MTVLWSLSIASVAAWAAWAMSDEPIIVFAAGYACAVHAEHLWDLLVSYEGYRRSRWRTRH
jgi:hypothetical protein